MKASLKADFWDTDKYANYIYALLKYGTLNQQLSESARAELDGLTWDHTAQKIFTRLSAIVNQLKNNALHLFLLSGSPAFPAEKL